MRRGGRALVVTALVVFIFIVHRWLHFDPTSTPIPEFLSGLAHHQPAAAATAAAMSVKHIVLFEFKKDADEYAVGQACKHMLSLKEHCVHPQTQKPYIRSLTGGKDHSPEGLQNGIQYGFIVEFGSLEDRDYYVTKDPTHQAFIKGRGPIIEKAIVVDYTAGGF